MDVYFAICILSSHNQHVFDYFKPMWKHFEANRRYALYMSGKQVLDEDYIDASIETLSTYVGVTQGKDFWLGETTYLPLENVRFRSVYNCDSEFDNGIYMSGLVVEAFERAFAKWTCRTHHYHADFIRRSIQTTFICLAHSKRRSQYKLPHLPMELILMICGYMGVVFPSYNNLSSILV